jgi:hypothetical protein
MVDKQAWYQHNSSVRVSTLLVFGVLSYLSVHYLLDAPVPLDEKGLSKVGCQEEGYFCGYFVLGPQNLYRTFISGIGSEFKGVTVYYSFSPKTSVFDSTEHFSLPVSGTFVVERINKGMVDKIMFEQSFSVELGCSKKQSKVSCSDFNLTSLRSLQPEEYRITLQLRNNDVLLSKLDTLSLRSELESIESGRKLQTHQWMVFLVTAVFFFAALIYRVSRCFSMSDRYEQLAVIPLAFALCGMNLPYFSKDDTALVQSCPGSLMFLWSLPLPILAFTLSCAILIEPIKAVVRKKSNICCRQELFNFYHFVAAVVVLLFMVVLCQPGVHLRAYVRRIQALSSNLCGPFRKTFVSFARIF